MEYFVAERLNTRSRPLSDPIEWNIYHLFSCSPSRTVSKDKEQIASLKQNCALFSQLCQVRQGDLDELFRHENQSCLPSLSQNGKMYQGTKSDLLHYLTEMSSGPTEIPVVEAVALDCAAIVNMLKPGASKTIHSMFSCHISESNCTE